MGDRVCIPMFFVLRRVMKLLALIGAGVAAGYCYKKMKNRKQNPKNAQLDESTKNSQLDENVKFENITV